MRITGTHVVPHPPPRVWEALLDPRVLVATIPGCERLEATGEHAYDMTVTAGVAAIKGTYAGTCALSDLVEPASLVMRLQGSGAPGTVDATVTVGFADLGEAGTEISYDADAVVGGVVGGVGQRMLTSVSKRMAAEFFGNVERTISAPATAEAESAEAPPEAGAANQAVFTPPPAVAASAGSRDEFLRGVAVGAGLVALGVLLGSVAARRR